MLGHPVPTLPVGVTPLLRDHLVRHLDHLAVDLLTRTILLAIQPGVVCLTAQPTDTSGVTDKPEPTVTHPGDTSDLGIEWSLDQHAHPEGWGRRLEVLDQSLMVAVHNGLGNLFEGLALGEVGVQELGHRSYLLRLTWQGQTRAPPCGSCTPSSRPSPRRRRRSPARWPWSRPWRTARHPAEGTGRSGTMRSGYPLRGQPQGGSSGLQPTGWWCLPCPFLS